MIAPAHVPQLVEDYLTWYFADNPAHAQLLGAQGFDGRLGDHSAEAMLRRDREAAA